MSKLMNYHRQKALSACIAEIIGVVDAPSAIMVSIHEDDDMLIWRACQNIVETLQMKGGEITVAIECIEVRT